MAAWPAANDGGLASRQKQNERNVSSEGINFQTSKDDLVARITNAAAIALRLVCAGTS